MRILIRTSKWAIWARRLGAVALPVAIIPVLMHRAGFITSDTFEIVEAAAIAIALAALVLALGAFVRLWVSGDRGWGRASMATLFSLVCLAPAAYLVGLSVRFPMVMDISTDATDPPPLVSAAAPAAPDEAQRLALGTLFPNVQPRIYPLGADQVFALAEDQARESGWNIRLSQPPQTPLDEGRLNAVVTTLLGWRDEVSIRIRGGTGGARVDMRSTSFSPIHEVGSNGTRIEKFLVALDGAVTVLLRDTASGAPPVPAPAPR
jgi:hypothetical protein